MLRIVLLLAITALAEPRFRIIEDPVGHPAYVFDPESGRMWKITNTELSGMVLSPVPYRKVNEFTQTHLSDSLFALPYAPDSLKKEWRPQPAETPPPEEIQGAKPWVVLTTIAGIIGMAVVITALATQ